MEYKFIKINNEVINIDLITHIEHTMQGYNNHHRTTIYFSGNGCINFYDDELYNNLINYLNVTSL